MITALRNSLISVQLSLSAKMLDYSADDIMSLNNLFNLALTGAFLGGFTDYQKPIGFTELA